MPRFLVTFVTGQKVIVTASSAQDARTQVAIKKARIAANTNATPAQKDEFFKRSRVRSVQKEKS